MERIHIRFLRFSAFYSPLLMTMSAGCLAEEGLEATFDVVGPGRSIADGIAEGSVDVAQSATAVSFDPWAEGLLLPFRHFALMNRRDGFFLLRRGPADVAVGADGDAWTALAGTTIVADHFFQPLALLRCALSERGVDTSGVTFVDAGDPAAIEESFRSGTGDVVHLQGPAPQQLAHDGVGHLVGSVGEAAWEIAFSSLCASPEWLATDVAAAFTRAFEKGRTLAREEHPDVVARSVAPYLPGIDHGPLTEAIAAYQAMGTWSGGIEIDPALYGRTVELFQRFGGLAVTPSYDDVVAAVPR